MQSLKKDVAKEGKDCERWAVTVAFAPVTRS
jgi:hypothetical protein